ncbi:MAG: bifunctional diaminohydroxyphosphoribosylaminopyrimidine deaminase/5-amino-6-(5-phosphoribosylamino)uracil reductase RibD [Rhodobacteraceae bacterium]|nr:bifunctional diaminohydroxyphosphoribosylaminopyrimidine deaminase/5-amino-6-(5-phosphoribosylamino)uracil reductase RibD [Paracoccaceae bacterium]
MALALALGARGQGNTSPNPAVGCVIVQGGRIVGRGWTQPGGRPHAEVAALTQAGDAAKGADVYVTLEPCAHHGKTPPCAEALVAAGVKRVIYAVGDPDPRVAGEGAAILKRAGIEVVSGVLEDEAARAHAGFFSRLKDGRPLCTLKLATSFDGRIATATGESQWITGPDARRAVHGLRARHDGILVGAGTARADDPQLTVRGRGDTHQPVRIVASRRLDIPLTGKLVATAREAPVWLVHGEDASADLRAAWDGLGARLIPVGLAGRQLDMVQMMQALGAAGLNTVFCEGGGALAASLLDAGQVDCLVGYTAGIALGAEGQPAIGAMGLDRLAQAPRFSLESSRRIGADIEHVWRRSAP